MRKRKIILGITGASGAIYAKLLLEAIDLVKNEIAEIGIMMSENARKVWEYELEETPVFPSYSKLYKKNDFNAPFASGSASYDTLIICPCSMGTLGRIAHGVSDDLLTRSADVILKEKRNLILVPRETPFNLIHLKNMTAVHEAGGTIIPAIPSFYSRPKTIEDVAKTVIDRVMSQAGFEVGGYEWGG